jgi:hypothetical protein
LLNRLSKRHFNHVSPELRSTILDYYSNLQAPFAAKKNKKKWEKTVQQLAELKAYTPGVGD